MRNSSVITHTQLMRLWCLVPCSSCFLAQGATFMFSVSKRLCSLVVQSFRWPFVFFSLLFIEQTHTVIISFHLYENDSTQPQVWVWGSDVTALFSETRHSQNSPSVNSAVCFLLLQSWRESSCSSARVVSINLLYDGEEGPHYVSTQCVKLNTVQRKMAHTSSSDDDDDDGE